MTRLFGTDGVRGVANRDLTAELALALAVSGAHQLTSDAVAAGRRPLAVVGRDPRASGEFLEAVVVGGLASAGVDVLRLGVLPTPAVAHLTAVAGADFGVMLSASHNPMPDNGVKFFQRGGHKLDDAVEDAIEAGLKERWARPEGAGVGRISDYPDPGSAYADHLVGTIDASLDGLSVVLDCANGAASVAAPAAFSRLGARVVAINDRPDGLNINDGCGSTELGPLQNAVRQHRPDVGFAFDGDADRCLAVDASGETVDGDQLLAILALEQHSAGSLPDATVVSTLMSNLGFLQAMQAAGLRVIQANIGDRYVLEAMRAGGYTLGGEQSGHIIMARYATTGDGILAALHVASRMASTGSPLSVLAGVVQRLPQVLVNVPLDKHQAYADADVAAAVAAAEAELGGTGRVLLRPSGTEPLMRVMVEAPSAEQAEAVAHRLAAIVKGP